MINATAILGRPLQLLRRLFERLFSSIFSGEVRVRKLQTIQEGASQCWFEISLPYVGRHGGAGCSFGVRPLLRAGSLLDDSALCVARVG